MEQRYNQSNQHKPPTRVEKSDYPIFMVKVENIVYTCVHELFKEKSDVGFFGLDGPKPILDWGDVQRSAGSNIKHSLKLYIGNEKSHEGCNEEVGIILEKNGDVTQDKSWLRRIQELESSVKDLDNKQNYIKVVPLEFDARNFAYKSSKKQIKLHGQLEYKTSNQSINRLRLRLPLNVWAPYEQDESIAPFRLPKPEERPSSIQRALLCVLYRFCMGCYPWQELEEFPSTIEAVQLPRQINSLPGTFRSNMRNLFLFQEIFYQENSSIKQKHLALCEQFEQHLQQKLPHHELFFSVWKGTKTFESCSALWSELKAKFDTEPHDIIERRVKTSLTKEPEPPVQSEVSQPQTDQKEVVQELQEDLTPPQNPDFLYFHPTKGGRPQKTKAAEIARNICNLPTHNHLILPDGVTTADGQEDSIIAQWVKFLKKNPNYLDSLHKQQKSGAESTNAAQKKAPESQSPSLQNQEQNTPEEIASDAEVPSSSSVSAAEPSSPTQDATDSEHHTEKEAEQNVKERSKPEDLALNTQKDLGFSTQKDLGLNTQKDLEFNTKKNFGLNTQKDLGLSTQKDLGLSTQKNLGLSTQKDLGLSTQKDLGLSTQKDLGFSTQKDLGLSTQKDLGLSTQKNFGKEETKPQATHCLHELRDTIQQFPTNSLMQYLEEDDRNLIQKLIKRRESWELPDVEDPSEVIGSPWLDDTLFPILDLCTMIFSSVSIKKYYQEIDASTHKAIEEILFSKLPSIFEQYNWFRVIKMIPFTTEVDFDKDDYNILGSVDVYDSNLRNYVYSIHKYGLIDFQTDEIVRKVMLYTCS